MAGGYGKMRSVWSAPHADDKVRTETWPGLGHVSVADMQDAAYTLAGEGAVDGRPSPELRSG
ncbi:hypothetical protein ACFQX7_40010 [Luedemannella flava]